MKAEQFCTGQSKDKKGISFLFQPMTAEQLCTDQSKDNEDRESILISANDSRAVLQ